MQMHKIFYSSDHSSMQRGKVFVSIENVPLFVFKLNAVPTMIQLTFNLEEVRENEFETRSSRSFVFIGKHGTGRQPEEELEHIKNDISFLRTYIQQENPDCIRI